MVSDDSDDECGGYPKTAKDKSKRKRKLRQVVESDDDDSNDRDDSSDEFDGMIRQPNSRSQLKRKAYTAFESDESDSDDNEDDNGDDDDDDDDGNDDDDDGNDDDDSGESEEEGNDTDDDADEGLDPDVNMSDDEISSNTDQCPICLMSLSGQELGTPNSCQHVFCLECILEWSKNAVTCPVDRKEFTELIVHSTKKGPVLRRIPVEPRPVEEDEWEDEPTYCQVCHQCDREDRLLLCDDCDNGYHMECLSPSLEYVPIEEWYCPVCVPRHQDEASEGGQSEAEMNRESSPRPGMSSESPRRTRAPTASSSSDPGVTRRARTAASTRERRGSTRARGSSRRGTGTRSSTRGRRRSATSTRGRTRSRSTRGRGRTKSRGRGRTKSSTRGNGSAATPGRKRTKRRTCKKRRTKKKTTKSKRTAKRPKLEEDAFVNPFEGPTRRGRTVKERLNESLRAPGSSTDMGRTLANCPFPSRMEPTLSFSLFGNSYSLEVSESCEENTAEGETESAGSDSDDPAADRDVLGSILDGLDTLNSRHTTLSRDGRLIDKTRDQNKALSRDQDQSKCRDIQNTQSQDNSRDDDRRLSERLKDRDSAREVVRDEKKMKALEAIAAQRAKGKNKPAALGEDYGHSAVKSEQNSSEAREQIHEPRSHRPAVASLSRDIARALSSCSTPRSRGKKSTQSPAPTTTRFRIPKKASSSASDVAVQPSKESPGPSQESSASSSSVLSETFTKQNNANKYSVRDAAVLSSKESSCSSKKSSASSSSSTKQNSTKKSSSALSSSVKASTVRPSTHVTGKSPRKHADDKHTCASSKSGSSDVKKMHSTFVQSADKTRHSASHTSSQSGFTSIPTGQSSLTGSDTLRGVNEKISQRTVKILNSSSEQEPLSKHVPHCRAETPEEARMTPLKPLPVKTPSRADNSVLDSGIQALKSRDICSETSRDQSCASRDQDVRSRDSAPVNHRHSGNLAIIQMLKDKTSNMRAEIQQLSPLGSSNGRSSEVPLPSSSLGLLSHSDTLASGLQARSIPLPRLQAHAVPLPRDPSGLHAHTVPLPRDPNGLQAHTVQLTRNLTGLLGHSSQVSAGQSARSGLLPIAIVRPSPLAASRVVSIPDITGTGSGRALEVVDVKTMQHEERDESRKKGIARLRFISQVVDEVKLALRPYFSHHEINKDEYKDILKRAVDKIKESNHHVDRERVASLIKKYVKKFKGQRYKPPMPVHHP